MLNMQQQQHQQQHSSAATAVANNNNNNFEILTLGHIKHTLSQPNLSETSCFGQFANIHAPIDFQPIAGHNNNFGQHSYGFIANLSTATKDNMILNLQTTAPEKDLQNGGNFHNGCTDDETPTYILLQSNYNSVENVQPIKIDSKLVIVHGNDGHQSEEGDTEVETADLPMDLRLNDENENSGSLAGSDEGLVLMGGTGSEEKTPDHHARRPMNAFLIFCKRHRAIVREKYPNLENRSITKILGDWWANLDKDEKVCYTSLAKQYKDAFFTANPNFKWYKLPAPPLRSSTMAVRSANGLDRDLYRFDSITSSNSSHSSQNSAIKRDANSDGCYNSSNGHQANVGLFKLADEAQMGGLNSLMLSPETFQNKSVSHNNNNGEISDNYTNQITRDQNALHKAIGETASYLERTISGSSDGEAFSPRIVHADKCVSNVTGSIPLIKKDAEEAAFSSPEKSFEFYYGSAKKSSRACKGKRYLEFMTARKLSPVTKKAKPRTNSSSSPTYLPAGNGFAHNGNHKVANSLIVKMDYENFDHLYAHQVPRVIGDEYRNGGHSAMLNEAKDVKKLYDANDFELEEKIKALPAHILDKYLSRKRDTKKKKKVGNKRNNGISNGNNQYKEEPKKEVETALEAKERMMMVGSQKRKARKESITRRDVANITAIVDNINVKAEMDVKMHMDVPSVHAVPNTNSGTSDLLILATIAEAAANAV